MKKYRFTLKDSNEKPHHFFCNAAGIMEAALRACLKRDELEKTLKTQFDVTCIELVISL
jgi:hypothetical protein